MELNHRDHPLAPLAKCILHAALETDILVMYRCRHENARWGYTPQFFTVGVPSNYGQTI